MDDECCICYEIKKLDETICHHYFCKECLSQLYLCPLCRRKIKNKPIEKSIEISYVERNRYKYRLGQVIEFLFGNKWIVSFIIIILFQIYIYAISFTISEMRILNI